MFKIIIQDKNLNEFTFYKLDKEVDIFIEWGIRDGIWGSIEDLIVIKEELTLDQIEAWNYLRDTDWYALRKADSGMEIPDGVSYFREEARLIL